ncbi:TetR/AcrR family transcriptional regulator [Cellulomonas sp. NPDC055163]
MSTEREDPPTSTRRRARSPRGHGAQLRREILEAAATLLEEHGTEQAVTLRAVAREVGIAAPSIYAHFPTREDIVLAVVEDAFAALERHVGSAAGAAPDPVDRLRAVSRAYVDFAARWPRRYRAMFSGTWTPRPAAPQSPDVADEHTSLVGAEALGILVAVIGDCATAGRSASTDPFGDAVALWTALHGLAELQPAAPHFPWPDDLVDRLVDRLARLT